MAFAGRAFFMDQLKKFRFSVYATLVLPHSYTLKTFILKNFHESI